MPLFDRGKCLLRRAHLRMNALLVGTSRCDVPARVERAEPRADALTRRKIPPLCAARTAQRAVLTIGNAGAGGRRNTRTASLPHERQVLCGRDFAGYNQPFRACSP